ncbi:MAG: hypothetical protein PGN13_03660 [Patulibacter minatonensis]
MPLITLAVVLGIGLGAVARRRTERADDFVRAALDVVMLLLIPLIGYAYATRLELNLSTVAGLVGGYAVIAVIGLLAWQLSARLHLTPAQQGGVVLATVLANTGYLGLPVAHELLRDGEFPQSVAWDSLISQPMALLIAPFIAAAFSPTHGGDVHVGQQLVAVLRRAPAIPALIAGLLVPESWAPQWLLDVATVCIYAILPLGFFAVGVTIMRLRHEGERAPRPAVGLILGLRNVVAPVLFLVLGLLVLPDAPRAFALQAAMPCGLNALVIGHAFDLDTGVIATAIAWSTAIVLAVSLVGVVLF